MIVPGDLVVSQRGYSTALFAGFGRYVTDGGQKLTRMYGLSGTLDDAVGLVVYNTNISLPLPTGSTIVMVLVSGQAKRPYYALDTSLEVVP